jgi:penicillin amidase
MPQDRRRIAVAVLLLVCAVVAPGASDAADQGWTILIVDGKPARIYRDEFGVPHIFAETNRGLFVAYGYAVAEDRLWQLELNRRASYGRLAEIFGPGSLNADRNRRLLGYTNAELDAQLALLGFEEQEILGAYAEGINRYLADVVAPAPLTKLPFEFHVLGLGVPDPWTTRDVVAFAVRSVVNPPLSGQRELANQALLGNLITRHGLTAGFEIFADVLWINDPDAPVTIPVVGAMGKRHHARPVPVGLSAQLRGASERAPRTLDDEAGEIQHSLGLTTGLGSVGWVISPARSASGAAMLFGGPALDPLSMTPAVMHEVQLHGGNGFNVAGMAFAGVPLVLAGRTDHLAWTLTTAAAIDNTDTYIETLCGDATGYLFNGACTPFESRQEVIPVRGGAPVVFEVRRSIHGPVVSGNGPGGQCVAGATVCHSRKRAFAGREIEEVRAFLGFNRARNLQQFQGAVGHVVQGLNFLYADAVGNIAFWQAGLVPVRPPGFDPRLPLPGDGTAEWTGEFKPVLVSINPARGWLANWNQKPSIDHDNPDHQTFGKQHRLLDVEDHLDGHERLSVEDIRRIARDISRGRGMLGREARFLRPYLLAALDAVPPSHPLAAQARAALEAWDGGLFADPIASTTLEPGHVVFAAWLDRIVAAVFGDELGADLAAFSVNIPNMLLHVLDQALGTGSGVPPSLDYFNGADPNATISVAFDDALAALGDNPALWSAQPRPTVQFRHALFPAVPQIGTILDANRGTYAQIVVLGKSAVTGQSHLPLGQSGFIEGAPPGPPALDPHFSDQLELCRNFDYKPLPLYRNIRLKE